ncbi:hypothetical protein RDABS01_021988, partial [Bienertia sinuspersici]
MRKGTNWINGTKEEDGTWIHDDDTVAKYFYKHFENLFSLSKEDGRRLEASSDCRNTPTKFIHFMRKPLGVGSQQSMRVYVGCLMDVDERKNSCFPSIHDRILKSISSWSYSCLSTTGRCTLINSVLMALAAHIISIYLLSKKLLNKINSTILKFYWGGNKKQQNVLELRKEEGGIGLQNVISLNKALLFRQVWRINKRPDSLISRILHKKYGGNPLQVARKTQTPINTSWVFKSLVKCARILLPGCGKKIGNEQNTSILEDTWVGNSLVKFKSDVPSDQVETPKH